MSPSAWLRRVSASSRAREIRSAWMAVMTEKAASPATTVAPKETARRFRRTNFPNR